MIQFQFTASRLDNGESITGNLCQLADGTFIMPQDCFGSFRQPPFHSEWMMESMGERGATGQYEAMRYGWEYCVQRFRQFVPPLIAVDPISVRRIIDLGDTEIKTTEELQAMHDTISEEASLVCRKEKILASIISKRLRDAAEETRPWKVGDSVEVLVQYKKGWIEGVCIDELSPRGFNRIAVKNKDGSPHKSARLRPDRDQAGWLRFNGKIYTFEFDGSDKPAYYKEVKP